MSTVRVDLEAPPTRWQRARGSLARVWRKVAIGVEAVLVLIWASVAVRISSGPKISRRLGDPAEPLPGRTRAPVQARLVGKAVGRVARLMPWRPNCLPQAIATQVMLRRRSISYESHLGVVNTAPFKAHAWVTVNGTTVVGAPTHHATRLATFHWEPDADEAS